MNRLQVGKKVRVTDQESIFFGDIGVITEDDGGSFFPFDVKFENGLRDYFNFEEIEEIKEEINE